MSISVISVSVCKDVTTRLTYNGWYKRFPDCAMSYLHGVYCLYHLLSSHPVSHHHLPEQLTDLRFVSRLRDNIVLSFGVLHWQRVTFLGA
jgi:hypothetical protein